MNTTIQFTNPDGTTGTVDFPHGTTFHNVRITPIQHPVLPPLERLKEFCGLLGSTDEWFVSELVSALEKFKQAAKYLGVAGAGITGVSELTVAAARASAEYRERLDQRAVALLNEVEASGLCEKEITIPDAIHALIREGTRLQQEKEDWMDTAAQQNRNAEYYQQAIDRIGLLFGRAAFICDDGSLSDTLLRAKVPDLVFDAMQELWGHRQRREADALVQSMECRQGTPAPDQPR